MGKKKMKLPFPFKSKGKLVSTSWQWPTCGNPKTFSFRAKNDASSSGSSFFKTMNCAYVDANNMELVEIPDLCCRNNSYECASFSSVFREEESVETVIRGLRSERLFFEPGETSSILEKAKMDGFPFKESLVMAVDSRDPFADFRRSMEEMVEAHGLKDWESLEDLLTCYLRVNGKSNHGYIVGAFVDLLVGLAFAASSSSSPPAGTDSDPVFVSTSSDHYHCSSSMTRSFTSPLSFSSFTASTSTCSPSLSLVEVEDEIEKSIENASSSDV